MVFLCSDLHIGVFQELPIQICFRLKVLLAPGSCWWMIPTSQPWQTASDFSNVMAFVVIAPMFELQFSPFVILFFLSSVDQVQPSSRSSASKGTNTTKAPSTVWRGATVGSCWLRAPMINTSKSYRSVQKRATPQVGGFCMSACRQLLVGRVSFVFVVWFFRSRPGVQHARRHHQRPGLHGGPRKWGRHLDQRWSWRL